MTSIILTRSDEDNARTARLLEGRGFDVISAPMIELRPIAHEQAELEQLVPAIAESVVLLTSAHATRLWLALRREVFRDGEPEGYLLVGSSSAALLDEGDPGVPVLAVADSAAALGEVTPASIGRIVYPCSRARRDEAIESLRSRGIEVTELPLYEPVVPADALERRDAALSRASHPLTIVFFSPSAVSSWFSLRSDTPADSIFLAIGPTTAAALRAHGVERVVIAGGGDGDALAGAIERAIASL